MERNNHRACRWVEYFRLELTYAARLAARRRLLGVDEQGERCTVAQRRIKYTVHRGSSQRPSRWCTVHGAGARVSGASGTTDAAVAAADGAADRNGQAGAAEAGEPSGAALQAVLGGGIARIVFANAIAARPDDVELRRRFLDALAAFQLPGQDY